MESQRQKKVARLIQKELGTIFQIDRKGIFNTSLVTVVHVKISPDLSIATVYLSMSMIENKQEVFDHIVERKSEIRNVLGRRVGKQLRITPNLVFFQDEVEENAARLDEIFKNLNIPPAEDEKED